MAWFSYLDENDKNRIINTDHILDVVYTYRADMQLHRAIVTLAPPISFEPDAVLASIKTIEVTRERIYLETKDTLALLKLLESLGLEGYTMDIAQANHEHNLRRSPCYIYKDGAEDDIYFCFWGQCYYGHIEVKWLHDGRWYYAEGEDSDPSYLDATTFTFETPYEDIEVAYSKIESRDFHFHSYINGNYRLY